jgi:chloramphenicol-sensitive protein RarD
MILRRAWGILADCRGDSIEVKKGIWYALAAYIFWGLFPFYWKILGTIPALQILGHRIVWSFITLLVFMLITRQWLDLRKTLTRRVLLIYAAAAVLISINWLTYIWAIGAGYLIETSLGYFINPLLSVFLGVLFLRERLRPLQWLSIGLATSGVFYLTFAYGALPWIALTLAFSFAFYGLVKKSAPLSSMHGLTLETGLLFLPAMAFLLYSESTGVGAFLHASPLLDLMMVGAGLVTITPLLFFASAVRRIPLSMIGVLQYINPTIQFLIGTLVFREPFDTHRLIGFGIVWAALVLFVVEGLLVRPKVAEAVS